MKEEAAKVVIEEKDKSCCTPQSKAHAACCCFLCVVGGAAGVFGLNELTGVLFGKMCFSWKIAVPVGAGIGSFLGVKDCCLLWCCNGKEKESKPVSDRAKGDDVVSEQPLTDTVVRDYGSGDTGQVMEHFALQKLTVLSGVPAEDRAAVEQEYDAAVTELMAFMSAAS